jgi:hypothetical protein
MQSANALIKFNFMQMEPQFQQDRSKINAGGRCTHLKKPDRQILKNVKILSLSVTCARPFRLSGAMSSLSPSNTRGKVKLSNICKYLKNLVERKMISSGCFGAITSGGKKKP